MLAGITARKLHDLCRASALGLVILTGAFFLTACEEEGTAEKAGKKVDEAVEQTADELGEAAEEIKEQSE